VNTNKLITEKDCKFYKDSERTVIHFEDDWGESLKHKTGVLQLGWFDFTTMFISQSKQQSTISLKN
jgi:hypothetical protein